MLQYVRLLRTWSILQAPAELTAESMLQEQAASCRLGESLSTEEQTCCSLEIQTKGRACSNGGNKILAPGTGPRAASISRAQLQRHPWTSLGSVRRQSGLRHAWLGLSGLEQCSEMSPVLSLTPHTEAHPLQAAPAPFRCQRTWPDNTLSRRFLQYKKLSRACRADRPHNW